METASYLITYETKCRRCGKIHEWFFANKTDTNLSLSEYDSWAREKAGYPSFDKCDGCERLTVQDMVSYNYPE